MALSLKISLDGGKVVKTTQFDPSTTVYDACRIIREKNPDICTGEPKDYGLFLVSDEEAKKGIWLEASRNLDYYILRNGDVLEYNKKIRNLRVRMLDGTVKTLLVDDSQVVANLMVVICTKIGITNYDEYGLVREECKEEPDPCDKPHYGTLTLRRKHQDNKDRDVKMDMLRKKLRTDDEVNWVEPGKTLREQGVELSETLLLRRKLFFSDRNVDSRDPVQLNLLYVQARDAILDDTHPVTCDKACEFAGIQCQIQFGDHKEDKHTPGFLDLKEFLPTSYVKVKGIEKKVFREHRRHIGLSELDAKVLYTKSARALNTYGVAFFLVKEKMKGKNKLVPRLLGVSKDSVLRLDEKTKEPLQSWPLTTVRRWCASPNTFTLDFGDYSDQYYSVQTTEAEQILQVIAGYIDIILRKQRAKDHLGIEGDEGSAMMEDSVAPSKAHIIQHDTLQAGKVAHTECVAQPGVLRQPSADQKSYAMSHLTGAQHTTVSGQIITGHTPPTSGQAQQSRVSSVLSEPQRALLSTISSGREVIRQTETELIRAEVPDLGHDAASLKWKQVTLDSNKQAVTSHIAAMNAATAQVVTLTSGPTEEVDHTAVGAAITTITSNLPEMTKGVQMIAALMDDSDGGDKLLDATRKLCSAFSDLLRAAEPETKEPRQNLLNAASRVGEASTSVLHSIDEHPQDNETQDILLSLAKAVANTTAALVLRAKHVAAQCRDTPQAQHDIIAAATHCALATSQLVACTKVVASTLQSPQCRAQLAAAARLVSSAVDRLLSSAETSPSSAELNAAAAEVSAALQRLLRHASLDDRTQASETEVSVENVMSATERLVSAGDAAEMVRQARLLGQASAHLITSIKTDAEKQPSEMQRKLLAAAKLLADATASMVEAARQCASAPQDRVKQEALRKAAEELRYITVDYAQGQDIVGTQITRLQETAKQAASSATQLITTAHNAAVYNTNKYSQETLHQECASLSSVLPRVNQAIIASATAPSPSAHLELISASESMLPPSGHAISAARATIPSLDNAACAKRLTATANDYTQACADLRSAVSRARISCKGLEIDAAIEIINSLQKELDMLQDCELRPLPGQDSAWAYSTISHSTRSAAAATAQLVSGARHTSPAAPAAADLAAALRDYAAGVGAAAAAHPNQRERLFSTSRQVLYNSQRLVELIKTYTSTSEQVDISTVTSVANSITQSMEKTLEAIPSHQELDMVTENINETLNIISMGEFPPSDRSYGELQEELQSAATQLNSASSDVVASVDRTRSLATAAQNYGDAYNRLVGCAAEMAAQQEDHDVQTTMVNCMKTVTVTSSKLLTTAKSVSQDLSRPNAKNQLAAAARDVTDAINQLVDVCTEASPTQRECEKAILRIQSAKPLLHDPTQAVTSLGYFASLDAVIDQSKGLSDGMSGMASSAKHSSPEQFAVAVRTVADSVCGLVECTAQAAYLVGISDETSVAGRPGLVDQAQFSRAALAIQQACRALSDTHASQQQVLSAATVIAKHTSALCNACRVASSKTTEAAPKRHFVQAAKDVANSTAALVKEIKMLDHDYNEVNRKSCAAATVPLQEAVRSLCQFADCPEFSAIPAKISAQAQENQRPMLDIGRNIITASCSMIEAGRAVALQPTDRVQWQSLADNSKHVSDSIKALVNTIREKAPGQRECTVATESLRAALREVDSAALAALAQNLPPRNAYTLQEYSSQIENSATEMLERVDPLRIAAKSEAENLGHAVTLIVSYVDPLVQWCVGAASLLTTEGASGEILDKTKTVLESLAALVMAAKHSAGNPRATGAHPEVDEASRDLHSALQELRTAGRTLSTQHGHVQQLLDTLSANVARVTSHRLSLIGGFDETDSFVDYQTRMMACLKELVALSTDMNAAAVTNPSRLTDIGTKACALYEKIARDGSGAAQVHQLGHVGERIRTSVVELGEALQEAIRCGARCRMSSTAPTQRDMSMACKTLSEKAVAVLSTLQAGSKGTQACIEAAAKIAAVMGDLETTILFASAGTLQAEQDGAFSEHREGILQTAKRLVEDTKKLVGGANAPHDRLAAAAMDSTVTMVELAEVVKLGASVLGPSVSELQVSLLHAARDVSAALRDLCSATAAAAADKSHTPALRDAAKRSTKRWSLPAPKPVASRPQWRRSMNVNNTSCDSETDVFNSDQEDELLKLQDYSSHDDDVSPSLFYDNCEEVVAYIEKFMLNPHRMVIKDEDLNERYNLTSRNSLMNMEWRVLKYGENIMLGEVRKFIDLVVDIDDKMDQRKTKDKMLRVKANDYLDNEMKRLSQVVEDLDSEMETETEVVKEITTTTISTMTTDVPHKKPKLENKSPETNLSSPVFKVKKVRPVSLNINLDVNIKKISEHTPTEPIKNEPIVVEPESPEQTQKDEATAVIVKPEIISKAVNKTEFWQLFTDDSERWKELAKRNLKKIEQNRLELQHFIDNEMVIGDIEEELSKYSKEKYTLQTFIDEVDESKIRNQDLEYDKKYEEIVLKLIAFAKKDINYKGFDPIIEKLKALSNLEIEPRRKKVVNIQEIINVYSQIDITKYTYEELCLLETYYKEIIRKYNHQNNVNKENLSPREIDPNYMRETKSASPAYHRNVILNLRSSENSVKNINQYTNSVTYGGSLNRSHSKRQKQQNNLEIFDLTRTYPIEYYANNWWSIYEDVLRNREQQYGSIDNWWRFYEAVQNKSEPDDIDLRRLRSVVKHRMRPQSRAEEQLKMLDEIHHDKFRESEDLTLHHDDSVMVTNVTSLLKTVKAVEDEHTRGLRALEATIEAIGQEITVLLSSSAPIATSTPSDLIRATRHMTAATARSATATTQDQYVAAANLGRKTVLDLLRACKSVAFNLDDQSHRSKVISAGQGAAAAFRALLMGVLRAGHDPQAKSELPDLARDVAAAVADITATVDTLKGSDWVDPDDPAVIAESELLGAAASIDAAAKKLEALRPRKSIKVQEADETLNFDEMILEAAKSIIAASSALVRAASASQRELIDQGKVSRRPSAWSDDGQWSEGLVSAARLVSAGAHALAESANALVQGLGSEERLISSATHVASCTAQLLVACKVKADPSSESTRRLQSAGAEVIRSTDNLVRAAKNAIRHEDERSLVLNRKMVGGIAQEIDARSEVLRIEKELEEARGRLSAIRQAKYKLKTGETSGEETDTDVYVGGYTSDSSAPHRYKNTSFNTTNNTSFGLNTTYSPNSTYSPKHNTTTQSIQQLSQSIHGSPYAYSAPEYNQHQYTQTVTSSTPNQNGGYVPKSPQTTFSSFKPAPQAQDDTQKQNYEGFTTRYETRLYDTPRPVHDYSKTEEQKQFESTQYNYSSSSHEQKSATPKLASPLSPKFNARDLKFEDSKSDFYSTVNKPSTPKFGDGIGQNFTETQRSTEVIPGGTKHTEYTIKSEAYSSFPKTEYIKSDTKEIKSPFVTSTPNKFEKTEYNQYAQRSEQSSFGKTTSSDLVRVVTPDRMTSPYGKEVQSYGGPNYTEETTTEVKDIPNGTQKITTTKVYSSSPVTMTTTNTKYEPIKLEGIDELSKSFDDESRYSTLDSKVSSDTSRSFLRPSDFHSNEYQTSVVKVKKPSELVKELDAMDKKFSKQTITSETIERRSVMTSSKKSETSSTVTKKFGNA